MAVYRLWTEAYPASPDAFDCLGLLYRERGERELAIASYAKALELDPNNVAAFSALGRFQGKE